MADKELAVIHCQPRIAWQGPFAVKMARGLERAGIPCMITDSRARRGGTPILLGTTLWRGVEQDGGDYLLVDRCQYGDTRHWVSLGWNGRGYRARWPENRDPSRWEAYGVPLEPWRTGKRVILCGQVGAYSPDWFSEEGWYSAVSDHCTHFRPHPMGDNPTGLPTATDFSDCKVAVVLNSSIAVQAIMAGIPVVTMDAGSMAWPITGHTIDDIRTPDREEWCHWLAWCQWSHDEIEEGRLWDSLW